MSYFFAVDPGDSHVGIAYFRDNQCVWADEFDPTRAMRYLGRVLPGAEVLVVERYQLYPHLAQLQQGSDMRTSQMVGALKWLAYQNGVPVVVQQAALKKPTEALIRHRGWPRQSTGAGADHAKDAETHGYAYLHKHGPDVLDQARRKTANDIFGS